MVSEFKVLENRKNESLLLKKKFNRNQLKNKIMNTNEEIKEMVKQNMQKLLYKIKKPMRHLAVEVAVVVKKCIIL